MSTIQLDGAETKLVPLFHAVDFGAPFIITLHNCIEAKFDHVTGDMVSYDIPDSEGLLRTVVMTRLAHERKLSGTELKFLRKATSTKQVDLAKVLDCQPEHLSKVEGGKHPLSPMAEKVARMYLFKAAAKHHKMPEGREKKLFHELLDQLFAGFKPVAAFEASELELHFSRESKIEKPIDAANDRSAEDIGDCAWLDTKEMVA